jgi:hypothetical protein
MRFYGALRKSKYGRDHGWFIELDGQRVGELVDWQFEDMFWCSYRVIAADDAGKDIVFRDDLWNASRFRFKNKQLTVYARHPFSGGGVIDGRVNMRGLYLLPADYPRKGNP